MKRFINKILLLLSCCLFLTSHSVVSKETELTKRDEVRQFIDNMVNKHGFSKVELNRLFEKATLRPRIIEIITRPAESKPWYEYRPIFITRKRISQGVDFLNANRETLNRAEEVYGVPPEIVTAIIGVETFYGRHKGRHSVFDALVTLGFDYPPRSKFFLEELEQFLLLAREEQLNPLEIKGSYAGAMGKAQFISSSYRHYAIDFDNDGKRDLWDNTVDAIGSVASYLAKHGWQRDQSIVHSATVSGDRYQQAMEKGIKPQLKISELENYGIKVDGQISGDQSGALFALENKSGLNYWVGLNNFYVITRYNHSPLYAMAVYQLGQKILEQNDKRASKSNR